MTTLKKSRADIKRQADLAMANLKDDMAKLPSYFQSEHLSLSQRHAHNPGVNYGTDEKPGYFSQQAASA